VNTSLRNYGWFALAAIALSALLVTGISWVLLDVSVRAARLQDAGALADVIAREISVLASGDRDGVPATPDKLGPVLSRMRPGDSYLGIRQMTRDQSVTLAFAGEPPRAGGLMLTRPIEGTPWELVLWRPHEPLGLPAGNNALYAVLLIVAFLIPVFAVLFAHQAIWRAIDHDLRSVARIFQDMRDGNLRVDYPMKLTESRAIFNYLRRTGQKLVTQQKRFRDLSLYDHLSRLHNRRAFEKKLAELFDRFRSTGPSSVLIIDLDRFKQVNDRHGHDTGDALIAEFSAILRALVRSGDFVARIGGDEFCVIFPHTPADLAVTRVQRLRDELPKTLALTPTYSHPLSWTAGLADMLSTDKRYDQVLWRADQALLRAKELGRNRTCVHLAGDIAEA